MGLWASVWAFLFLGYSLWGRSFAYLGIPQLQLFVGEIMLASFILLRPQALLGRWASWLLFRRMGALSGLAWALLAFLCYGLLQVLLGLARGHDPLLALRNLVFNVYPLYLFLGVAVGIHFPALLPRAVRWLAWLNGIYGALYLLVLNNLSVSLPWASDVSLFGQPGGSAVALMGLLVLEAKLSRAWFLFVLNLFVLLGVQVRGEWVAIALSLAVWALLRGRVLRLASLGMLFILLFGGLYVSGLNLPAPEQRGGELSARGLVARVVAPFDPDWAASLIGEKAYSFSGTITGWRIPWWLSIWETIHVSPVTALLGLGYGYPIWDLSEAIPEGIRTPHNVFFYILGYTGWIGACLFLIFVGTLMCGLYKALELSTVGEFVFVMCLGQIGASIFGNFFETPFGAIPFYLVAGYGLASLVGIYANFNSPHSIPAAGR